LKKENLTTGVLAGAVKISLFVMALIKEQILSLLNLLQKKPTQFIYADVKKQRANHFVMELIANNTAHCIVFLLTRSSKNELAESALQYSRQVLLSLIPSEFNE
jgi:hypothetical protein